eukprot:6823178-Alexandrium_andersonii.AAC.1
MSRQFCKLELPGAVEAVEACQPLRGPVGAVGALHLSDVPHLDIVACVLLLEGRVNWHAVLAEAVVELGDGLPKGFAIRRDVQPWARCH